MSRPSLFDSFLRFLAGEGYDVPADVLERDVRRRRTRRRGPTALLAVYRDDGEPAQVAERLVDLDEGVQEWRYRHVKMVERTIGDKPGHRRVAGRRVPAHHAVRARRSPTCGPSAASSDDRGWTTCVARRTPWPRTTRASAWPSGCCSPATPTRPGPTWPATAWSRPSTTPPTAVDDKWEPRLRAGPRRSAPAFRRLLDDPARRHRPRAESTHDLRRPAPVGADLHQRRPRLVTTDGEFHSLRRQLARLAEEGVEVVRVTAEPVDTLAERLAAAVDDRTARGAGVDRAVRAPPASCPTSPPLADACARHGAELLLDAYHALGVVPFPSTRWASATPGSPAAATSTSSWARATASCACRRTPTDVRPVVTGWFAEFGDLSTAATDPARVSYGPRRPALRRRHLRPVEPLPRGRACSTSSPTAGPDAGACSARSYRHQVGRCWPTRSTPWTCPTTSSPATATSPPEAFGGFLALRSPRAGQLQARCSAQRGVLTDSRGDVLRLGPAPYLSDAQLVAAVAALGEAVRELGG